jgi:small subunit ribosomal protein S8
MAENEIVESPYSKFREAALKKLEALGYITSYKVQEEDGKKMIQILLRYIKKKPVITDVRIFSKPGRRYYQTVRDMKPVKGGYGYAILSTSQGIMTNIEAQKSNIGGELLFHVW